MGTLSVEQLDDNYDAWRDLAARSLEPNAFLEPGFALQLARHAPARSRPRFVGVWREGVHVGEARRLVGLFALAPAGSAAGRRAGPALARQADRAGGALAGSRLRRGRAGALSGLARQIGAGGGRRFSASGRGWPASPGAAGRGAALRPGRRDARAVRARDAGAGLGRGRIMDARRGKEGAQGFAAPPAPARRTGRGGVFDCRRRPGRCATRWSSF